ncbi:phosphate ABC transporter permease [Erysipelothrix larvae]|uniref:Phosphate transport system permease protein PstA n=1 Tax=Erysipelothrix larvae TaxID=1514105 RepID=A0A120JTM7_9FIRM|nr:phosphate ABC transporter permease PstA [Erysipelothrix larvae]AMC93376.1 phosphate ABC transporter permease [Erysipelothrix larvae]
MTKRRKIIDGIYNAITMLASGTTVIALVLIFGFVAIRGVGTLSFDMLTNNYWSQNYLVHFENNQPSLFETPDDLGDDVYFSTQYGVALKDSINHEKKKEVLIVYIAEDSPFLTSVDASQGSNYLQPLSIDDNSIFNRLEYLNEEGVVSLTGLTMQENAETIVQNLDSASEITSLYFQTQGGGIWGSLLATLMLIAISIVIALPLGIFAAIYLTEIAKPGFLRNTIERAIEMLAGVPSIIFGLMGIAVLFPITALFNISGLSVLLGGMTMSIVLLPVIIRSVQESLVVVPRDYRYASLSLGATQTQTIFRVILPSALPGILSALLLAVSRIIGESAALIYTMGTFINDAPKLSTGATTLAVHIWTIMSGEQPNFELASAISIIILIIVFILNFSVKFLSRRLERKWQG